MTDWSTLRHAYGQASDVPAILAGLRSVENSVREQAEHEMWSALCHQDSIYSATGPAIEAIAEIALEPTTRLRHRLLYFIAYATSRGQRQGDEDGQGASDAGVRVAPEILAELQDGDRPTRVAVGCLLAVLGPGAGSGLTWCQAQTSSSRDDKESLFWRCCIAAQGGEPLAADVPEAVWRSMYTDDPIDEALGPGELALLAAEAGPLTEDW